MNIDFTPLSKKIDDEAIKSFIGQDGTNRSIISERFVKIANTISLISFAADVTTFVALSILARSLFFGFSLLFVLAQFSFLFLLFGPVISLIRKSQLSHLRKEILLTEFSRLNGLNYRESNCTQNYPGIMFNIGSDRKMIDQLVKESALVTYEISNYQYSQGSGDDKTTDTIGYIMIKLGRKLPHMVLDSNANNFKIFGKNLSNLPITIKTKQKLSLEGDFDKYFTLYAPKEYERDALYIFTPDLMASFIDTSGKFDAEIVDDMLFIYSSKPFDVLDVDVMKGLFDIIKIVGDKTFSRADRYSDEKISCQTENIVAVGGRRLKKSLSFGQIFVLIFVAAIFLSFFVFLVASIFPDFSKEVVELLTL